MIDLNKEKQAFERWWSENYDRDDFEVVEFSKILNGYESSEIWTDELNKAWSAWQAAKSQVPEGFVLVSKGVINVLKELTQFSSYAEIVGGISVNRSAIREQCDIAFNLIQEFEDAEFAEMIEAAQGEGHDNIE